MKTVAINVVKAVRGSPNGVTVVEYLPGTQDVPEELARVFLDMGVAEPVAPKPAAAPVAKPVAPKPSAAKPGPKPKASNARPGKV